ncbi:MAG TPA: FAD-dependent oxidoreductase [Planctomycetota bacterium]|nr:FAD-dependent oxidoreductase [Planctomycetota bacterium]OQC21324.1 MAG: hypothetical protein BWX69_01055 [Planctomycetes bacterium ADurb.Bin069]HNR99655.1 FAD-dependent oxidoreductase [Planctomycetota bacterium]HNU25217.1 FAD-dependent oxidoreductase [Planctomycetota bacterium]HOE30584.1 FAD-dependent oxidoreductase [Planctomycetota bacterium]
MRTPPYALLAAAALLLTPAKARNAAFVNESERALPCAAETDIVIAGGGTGAVAAAVAAREAGARVFLVAPHPYLGEDMTATLRLWLEPGEKPDTPLAERIFAGRSADPLALESDRLVPFTYQADRPSAGVHKDTAPPSLLRDGAWHSAARQSVQYDGGVRLLLKLAAEEDVEFVCVLAYHRADYRLGGVRADASPDGRTWTETGRAVNEALDQDSVDVPAVPIAVKVETRARYLALAIDPAPNAARVLIGEILVVRPGPVHAPTPVAPARPLQVKKILDAALVAAKVDFLYSSYVTDVLRGAGGELCGVAIANRGGRQAIKAKVIIDATDRAWVARMAGARFRPFPAGTHALGRVVIGGKPREGPGLAVREIRPPYTEQGVAYSIFDYTLTLPLAGGDYASLAAAEAAARGLTYDPGQRFTSDVFFQVPPDPMHGEAEDGGGGGALDLSALKPAGVPRMFVLGGCADVSRAAAARLLRPCALMALGERVGRAAAEEARAIAAAEAPRLRGAKCAEAPRGDVREILAGLRPAAERDLVDVVVQEPRALPILGEFDVVVAGGGTSGAPAGIAAARRGARTLVVEFLHGLGGVGTYGAISKYYWGNRVGFSAEVAGGASWEIEQKAEWWRATLAAAGADIWFGAMGCGVFAHRDRILGVVVATPAGRGVVLCKTLVDATGNADLAAAAGVPCVTTDALELAVQGTGLPPRKLGAGYTNTDFTIVDETDALDVWHVLVYAKILAGDAFDLGSLIDTRERRRIAGEATLTILDQLNRRTFPDTIVATYSDFDTHGYTVDPYFTLSHPPAGEGHRTNIPYRALLPKGVDGLIVAGLGISAHRDALPLIRMQPDLQNLGYAAGVAAAMAAAAGGNVRAIDVRELQAHLVAKGNLPAQVLTDRDSYPLPPERIAQAVAAAADDCKDAAVILAHREEALPLLLEAYGSAAEPAAKLAYARILAVLGDPAGLETILAAVEAFPGLDKGWRYTSQGQFGPNLSPLDRLIYALGRLRAPRAVPAILAKLALLTPESEFSHFRAAALALESIGDPAAAPALARVLALPGMQGHDIPTIERALAAAAERPNLNDTEGRNMALRELMLGRALLRCGDKDGLGKAILTRYAKDLRGHLARHAAAVLRGPER